MTSHQKLSRLERLAAYVAELDEQLVAGELDDYEFERRAYAAAAAFDREEC